MKKGERIFASSSRVAAMLDISRKEFLELVSGGHFPPATRIAGKIERWNINEVFRAVADFADDDEDFEW